MQARFKFHCLSTTFSLYPYPVPKWIAGLVFASTAFTVHAATTAATAPTTEVRFVIRDYAIEGAQLVPLERLRAAVAPYIGPDKTFTDIQNAVAAIDALYAQVGFSATQIDIAPQDITGGTVRLKIIESTLGNLSIIGNHYFDAANTRHALPQLVAGQAPNIRDVGTAVRLANENYAKQTQITFKQGENANTVDAVVRVTDSNPIRNVITLDNTGGKQTGKYRLGYAFQHANLSNSDHLLTAQYVTSPDHLSDVTILGGNYRVPFYRTGGDLDISASYSNVSSGVVATTAGSYAISGSGAVLGVHYTQLLPRIGEWDQRVSAGVDYHYYQNKVTPSGTNTSLVPDLVTHPLTLGYSGFARGEQREWRAGVNAIQNIPGGSRGTTAAFQAPGGRAAATANFRMIRFNVFVKQSLPADWALQAQLNGQYSADALISGEQFGIGGVESVRGFDEREISNDRGYRTSVELQSPDLSKSIGLADHRVQAIAFYDAGNVHRNHPLPGEKTGAAIASAGAGLRIGIGSNAQLRLDLASVLRGAGVRRSGEHMLHGNLTVQF